MPSPNKIQIIKALPPKLFNGLSSKPVMRRRTKVRDVMTRYQCHELEKKVHHVLITAYPGHIWGVNVHQGVITVKNMFTSGAMGFTLGIMQLDRKMSQVVNAGGEILERYRLKRGRLQFDDILGKERDFQGKLKHDA